VRHSHVRYGRNGKKRETSSSLSGRVGDVIDDVLAGSGGSIQPSRRTTCSQRASCGQDTRHNTVYRKWKPCLSVFCTSSVSSGPMKPKWLAQAGQEALSFGRVSQHRDTEKGRKRDTICQCRPLGYLTKPDSLSHPTAKPHQHTQRP